jgi:hypothetical protein
MPVNLQADSPVKKVALLPQANDPADRHRLI